MSKGKVDFSSFNVAANVANKYNVLWGDANVRIVFGDQVATDLPTCWHTHIMMNHADVIELIGLLERVKAQFEAKTATKQ